MGFVKAMKDFFGYNGGTAGTFAAELKALSDADKAEFKAMLSDHFGVEVA